MVIGRRRLLALLGGSVASPAILAATSRVGAAIAEPASASSFVDRLGQRTIQILQAGTSPEARRSGLAALLQEGFDLDYLGRLAMGRAWRTLSDEQRRHYLEAFHVWVLSTYSARLGAYAGQTFAILGAVPAGDDVAVQTAIGRPGEPAARVDWRVRETPGGPKIIDVVIEGVSMVVTQRREFEAIVQTRGVDGLIALLRTHT